MKTESLIVRVEPELKAKLQKMADQDRRTLADFVRLQLEKIVETNKTKK